MNITERLKKDGVINEVDANAIAAYELSKPMSVHWELKTILYLGILLIISGIGVLVYLNIDTLGHQVIIASILVMCLTCFYVAFKRKQPYSHQEQKNDSPITDYVVLFGCLLFGVFLGYLQFQYEVFGLNYGLATLIPTLVYFVFAYLFDHKGILSLGITGLTAWAGISATPMQLLSDNDFSRLEVILAAVAVGLLLAGVSKYSDTKKIKTHFSFTYNNFAANILFIATLAALFDKDFKIVSFIFLAAITFYYFKYAVTSQSFLFLLLSVLYGYIGFTYAFFMFLDTFAGSILGEIAWLYVLGSCVAIVLFFIYYKRILKIK